MFQPDKQQQDEFAAMLDRTLQARSQTEPRAGFQHRLAESLRQASVSQEPPHGWWKWLSASLSAAALAGLVAGSFVVMHHKHAAGQPKSSARVPHRLITVPQPVHVAVNVTKAIRQAREPGPSHRISALVLRGEAGTQVSAEALPRLETFPSPSIERGRPFGSGDPVASISPEAARAMLGLQQQQARPITLTALNVNRPLFGESQ